MSATAAAAPEGDSNGAVDHPASPVAQKISDLFWVITWIAFGVGIGVQLALFIVIRNSRRRIREEEEAGGAAAAPDDHRDEDVPDDGQPAEGVFRPRHFGDTRLEKVLFVITLAVFLTLGAISYGTLMEIESPPNGQFDMTVDVTGHQWFWEFHYPDPQYNITSVGKLAELHAPVGATVLLKITSKDVNHAAWIPDLGVKVDAIPGTINTFWFKATREGTFLLQCAEYCGGSHSDMHAVVVIESQAAFDAWVIAKQEAARPAPEVPRAEGGVFNIALEAQGPVPGVIDITDGANVSFRVTNNRSSASSLVFSGPYANNTMASLAPGETGWLNLSFDTPVKNGTYTCTGCAAAGSYNTSAGARIVEIELSQQAGSHGIWSIQPEEVHATPGEVLQFHITNVGSTSHNFTVGVFGSEILLATEGAGGNTTLSPGEELLSARFEVPDESKEYWCDVPGHYALGMQGKLVVEGGAPPSSTPPATTEPNVPGFGAVAVPFALIGAALFVSRRRRV